MKTYITVTNEQDKIKPDSNLLRKACRTALRYEKFDHDAEIDISVVDNEKIKEINREFREIDRETDVLSFPLGENGDYDTDPINGAYCLGDIVISAEKAVSQALLYGHSLERELAFLTVHSVLHLLGYDHVNNKEEEKIMFKKQEEILEKMGLSVK